MLLMCENTTMRVNAAWIKRYCILCSKSYNTLHSCHYFPSGSPQDTRGAHICEMSLLTQYWTQWENNRDWAYVRIWSHKRHLTLGVITMSHEHHGITDHQKLNCFLKNLVQVNSREFTRNLYHQLILMTIHQWPNTQITPRQLFLTGELCSCYWKYFENFIMV